ncbi:unnamed protein product, partial [Urochloa humidicola]
SDFVRRRQARRCAAASGSDDHAAVAEPVCSGDRQGLRTTTAARVRWPRSRSGQRATVAACVRRPRSQHAATSGGALYVNAASSKEELVFACVTSIRLLRLSRTVHSISSSSPTRPSHLWLWRQV